MTAEQSGWVQGFAAFAAVMLIIGGIFESVVALSAIIDDEFYVTTQKWVFTFDSSTWGWIHLLLGVVLVLAGIGILSGNVMARTVGVIAAGLSAVANFAFLPWYPIWAILVIAVDVVIIWALLAQRSGENVFSAD